MSVARFAAAPRLCARQLPRAQRIAVRHQSTSTNTSGGSSHIVSGLAGGVLVLIAGYGFYSYSAAGRLHSGINKTAKEANKYYNEATKKFQESTPDTNEAIEYLRKTAYSYAAFIPGGRSYVDAAFKDIDALREKHSDKLDTIMHDTYKDLQKVSKSGLSMESMQEALAVLEKMSKRLASEAGDAFSSLAENHPQLKEKVGGSLDQLKSLGDRFGPEAKKQAEQAQKEIQDVLKDGLNADSVTKVKKLVEEKIKQIQSMGDDAWNKVLEQAKPYLEKNPKVKELVEGNADALKHGDFAGMLNAVKEAVQSGKTEDLEKYVNQAKEKVQKEGSKISGGGFDLKSLFGMVPGGEQIVPKLSKLKEVAEKNKDEGEKLLKETIEEIQKVLGKQSKKAEELVDKAKKESKE